MGEEKKEYSVILIEEQNGFKPVLKIVDCSNAGDAFYPGIESEIRCIKEDYSCKRSSSQGPYFGEKTENGSVHFISFTMEHTTPCECKKNPYSFIHDFQKSKSTVIGSMMFLKISDTKLVDSTPSDIDLFQFALGKNENKKRRTCSDMMLRFCSSIFE